MNFEEDIRSDNRLVGPEPQRNEPAIDNNLRPQSLDQYIGQEQVRKSLSIFIQAALGRSEPLDHVLFHGFPGLGKTTLSYIIANEMGAGIKTTSGPVIEKQGDLAAILTSLQEGDVLFIDEIHRLNHAVEEVLYPAMEDFQLDLIIGQGPGARSVKMDLPKFTLVGATTRTGLLTPPLRDRFGVVLRLEFYSPEELVSIVQRSGNILGKLTTPGRSNWAVVPAARRELPTDCCGECGTLPRSVVIRWLIVRSPMMLSICLVLTGLGSMTWTVG